MSVKPDLELPASARDALGQEPYPVTFMAGRALYEIQQPVAVAGKSFGQIHLYLRRDVITDSVRVATTRMVAVMLVSLLLGLLCLWVVVRLLLSPIKPLVRGVNAVALGDFGVQVRIRRGDELGDLVTAYNGMANSLREKEAVQEALAKYTSKDLVNQMLSDKAQLGLGGQRVHATILFSVVRGMHALSSVLPAEEFVALINEYLEVETEAIMRNGGSIDKFIGDEVMAVWGLSGPDTPETRVRSAEQAVKSGVEVQEAIERLNAERVKRGEQPFMVSIGINNGEVVSGNMGSSVKMDYTVLGGNVNLAARLGLVAAQGGQTIISQSVFDLVGAKFKVDRLAPMQLKGIKEPVPLYWPRKALG
jgi:adenylate cyclase